MRLMWNWSILGAAGAILLAPLALALDGAEPTDRADAAIDNLIARAERDPVAYRAMRHLEAKSEKAQAWLDAWTEFDPRNGFTYGIVGEGGSGRIRNRVLKAVLNAEKQASGASECRRGAISPENYQFEPNGSHVDGSLALRLIPRREDSRLVDGVLFVAPRTGDPLRIEGRLAKSPSFWVRSVNVAWRYARIGTIPMPVEVQSQAQVRFFGSSTFSMTYDYEMVDGRAVP